MSDNQYKVTGRWGMFLHTARNHLQVHNAHHRGERAMITRAEATEQILAAKKAKGFPFIVATPTSTSPV
jgi:hypothetical protein